MVTQGNRGQRSSQESGQILVLATVSMVALLGITALTLDTSYMFAKRNLLHAAADAAAKSAAIEVLRNAGVAQASLEAFADQQVGAHGFVSTRLGGTTSVVVNRGPASGPFAGDASYVEVIVSEATSTFFGTLLGFVTMTPLASAVAGAGNPSACFIVQEDLTIGNTELVLNGCSVSVGRNLYGENPNAEIIGTPTPGVGVTGVCSGTCGAMGTLSTGAPVPIDPFVGKLAAPADPGGCSAGVAATISPGCYSSIAATVTTLNPGIYYITGPVQIANLSGSGVMLYLTGAGQLVGDNNKRLALTAPTSGPYTGIAIFQDPANAANFVTGNNFEVGVTGVIYMPGVDVIFPNALTFTATTCRLFIAKSLSIRNGSGFFSNTGCFSTFGGASFLTASIAQ